MKTRQGPPTTWRVQTLGRWETRRLGQQRKVDLLKRHHSISIGARWRRSRAGRGRSGRIKRYVVLLDRSVHSCTGLGRKAGYHATNEAHRTAQAR